MDVVVVVVAVVVVVVVFSKISESAPFCKLESQVIDFAWLIFSQIDQERENPKVGKV